MKTRIFRFFSLVLVALVSLFVFGCTLGASEERIEAKDAVAKLLSMDFGETNKDGVVLNAITSNIGIAEEGSIKATEEDLENGSYSGFLGGTVAASFTSSNPDVMNAEWITSKVRTYVKDADGNVTGVEMTETRSLMFVVNRQEEDAVVEIKITAKCPYVSDGKEYTYKASRTLTFTVAAKEQGEHIEMTIEEIVNEATADWTSFQQNGLRDGATIVTRGVVTEVLWGDGYDHHSFMINDGKASMEVYAPSTSSDVVEIGDLVEVTCVPTYYYNIIETKSGPEVKVILPGQEIPAAAGPMTVDQLYAAHDVANDHTVCGMRFKLTGILAYENNSFILKSETSDKTATVYYKSYTAYEQSLLMAAVGKPIILETAIYDAHSTGYFRLLPNVYDYPIVILEMTDEQRVAAVKQQLEAAEFKVKYEDGEELVLPEVSEEGVSVTWAFNPEGAYVDGKVVASEEGTLTLTATITAGNASDTFEKTVNIAPKAGEQPELIVVEQPEAGKSYKLYVNQVSAGKEIYFAGSMSGNYLATTEELAAGVDVLVEAVEGEFRLSFVNGENAKQYIDLYEYQTGKVGIRLTAEPTAVFTWDATTKTFFSEVLEGKVYYLGCYKTYTTVSASLTSYITGDNAANVDVSQFPVRLLEVKEPEPEGPVEQPEAGKSYNLYVNQVSAGKEIYFAGSMSGNYLATTEDLSAATPVLVEAVEGGFRLSFVNGENVKQYIDLYEYQTGKVGIRLTAEPTAVFTWDATTKTFFSEVLEGKVYYLGCYKTYTTVSASLTSYITGDNAANVDVSQFPVRLLEAEAQVEPEPEPVELSAFELYSDEDKVSHIDGAGVWIWVKGSSVGYASANDLSKFSVSAATFVAVSGEEYAVSDKFVSDPNEAFFRVYVVLNKGVAPTSEDKFTATITLAVDGVDTYQLAIEFDGCALAAGEQPFEFEHTGLTAEDAFTVEEVLAFMADFTDKQVSTQEYYVRGIASSSSFKSKYSSYTIWLENGDVAQAFELYSVGMDSSITDDFSAADALKGYEIVCKGYLQLYGTTFEMPYLNATTSPSGAAYTPTILSVAEPVVPHTGLTAEDAFTVEEVLAFMAEFTDKQVSTQEYYVRGIASSSTFKSKYSSYTIWLENGDVAQAFELYSVGMDSSITDDFSAADALKGYEIVCKGYLQLYGTTFEMPYLNATTSPSGAAYTPTIVSVVAGEEPEPEPEEPVELSAFELYSDEDKVSHIDGAGVWIWVKGSSVGYASANDLSKFSVSAATFVAVSGEEYAVSDKFVSDPNEAFFRVYVVLNKGVASTSEDKFTATITLAVDGVDTYQLAIEFDGCALHVESSDTGEEVTISKTMSQLVSENEYTVSVGSTIGTLATSIALDDVITMSTTGTANCGSFWGTGDAINWRLYQNKSGNLIVTAAEGHVIKSVTVVFTVSNTGTLLNGDVAVTSGTAVELENVSSVEFTVGNSGSATNGQVRITSITVVYE